QARPQPPAPERLHVVAESELVAGPARVVAVRADVETLRRELLVVPDVERLHAAERSERLLRLQEEGIDKEVVDLRGAALDRELQLHRLRPQRCGQRAEQRGDLGARRPTGTGGEGPAVENGEHTQQAARDDADVDRRVAALAGDEE